MAKIDKIYKEFCQEIIQNGRVKTDRTGTGTISIFDYNYKIDVSAEFPLLTSKKMHFKGILYELLWFLQGSTDATYLIDNDIKIWHGDLYKVYTIFDSKVKDDLDRKFLIDQKYFETDQDQKLIPHDLKTFSELLKTDKSFRYIFSHVGPIYGFQWRKFGQIINHDFVFPGVDQINELIELIKKDPDSRRLIVSAWNPSMTQQMILPPCHILFQCYTYELSTSERNKYVSKNRENYPDVSELRLLSDIDLDELGVPKRGIDLSFYMRSNDVPLGHPYNIASYTILLHMIAQVVGMAPMNVHFRGGDCHIYNNQLDAIGEHINRDTGLKGPTLKLNKEIKHIDDFRPEDFELVNYVSLSKIEIPLSN